MTRQATESAFSIRTETSFLKKEYYLNVRGKLIDVLEELNQVEDMAATKLEDAEEVLSSLLARLSSLPDEVDDSADSAVMMNRDQER